MAFFASILVILFLGGVIGFFVGRYTSSEHKKLQVLGEELENTQKELKQYQEKVTTHFKQTANLFANMTQQYQDVYNHLAGGAEELCQDTGFAEQLFVFTPKELTTETTPKPIHNERPEPSISDTLLSDDLLNPENNHEPFVAEPEITAPKDYAEPEEVK